MSVVARKRQRSITYYVTTYSEGLQHWERAGTDRREAQRLDARRKREVKNGTFVPNASSSTRVTVGRYAADFV